MSDKASLLRVAYIGSDTHYHNSISNYFRSFFPDQKFEFCKLFLPRNGYYHELFSDLAILNPNIIYLDFTEGARSLLSFAEFLGRDNFFKTIPLIGLWESKEILHIYLNCGVDLVFIKGKEFHDLIHAPVALAYPQIFKRAEFAQAKVRQEAEIISDFRLCYMAQDHVYVEGNFLLKKNQIVSLDTEISRRNVPSTKFKVRSIAEGDFYYDFRYGYRLDFLFC